LIPRPGEREREREVETARERERGRERGREVETTAVTNNHIDQALISELPG
jgi:hypothetical protein